MTKQVSDSDGWDLLRGWQAARSGTPLDEHEGKDWIEGWQLYHESSRAKVRKIRGRRRFGDRHPA